MSDCVNINEIPIFFAIDDGYAPYLGVALYSAIEHASPNRRYRAIILCQDISDENRKKIERLEKENFKIEFVSMANKLGMIKAREGHKLRCDYFTLTIYFRLFIPSMFPQYDKGIYIDSDVILCSDLALMFDTDIGDNYIGACTDLSIAGVPQIVYYIENAVGVPRGEYVNSGVLLMNIKKLREVGFDSHFLSLLDAYHPDCLAPDQDYINAMCNGRIFYLDTVWNTMPTEDKPSRPAPKLIHYNLFLKPWCYDGVQYGEMFWSAAEKTEFYTAVKNYKDNYGVKQKKSDKECMELLVSRGETLPAADVTFKKLYEHGERVRL